MGSCVEEFLCCEYDTSSGAWAETECRCTNGNVYDQVKTLPIYQFSEQKISSNVQDFELCSFPDMCGYRGLAGAGLGASYECDGGLTCPGL